MHHRLQAVRAISNPHAEATVLDSVLRFENRMLEISSAPALNSINISAAMRALEIVQFELRKGPSGSRTELEQHYMHIQAIAEKLIQRLQHILPQVGVRDAGSIVLCGAKLQLPSDVMPSDLITELIRKVVVEKADMNDSHAQSISQVLTALVVWARQGRDISIDRVQSLSEQLAAYLTRPAVWNNPQTCDISFKVMRALADLEPTPSVATLDVFIAHFCHTMPLLPIPASRKAYMTSKMFWCCYKFRYLPSADQAATMLAVFRGPLMTSLPKERHAHDISNVLLAAATLGLDCSTEIKLSLARMYTDSSVGAFVPNAMWGMAALNVLTLATFDKLLHLMVTSGYGSLPVGGVVQLQQAIHHLKPLSTAPIAEHRAWCAVDLKVANLFGRCSPRSHPCHQLCIGLQSLRVPCQQNTLFGVHQADAVLKLPSDSSALLLIVMTRPSNFLINHPERCVSLCSVSVSHLAQVNWLHTPPVCIVNVVFGLSV